MKLKTIIIDDEQEDVQALAHHLADDERIDLVETCDNGRDGLAAIRKHKPDLVFLDVEMPTMTGLEILERLGPGLLRRIHVVVYTSYVSYSVESFRKNAFDVLLKPIDEKDLIGIIDRAVAKCMEREEEAVNEVKERDYVIVYVDKTSDFRIADIRDIALFEFDKDEKLWRAYVKTDDPYPGKQVGRGYDVFYMKRGFTTEDVLGLAGHFVQIGRNHIVNYHYIIHVKDKQCLFYPPFKDITGVNVSRMYQKKLNEKFMYLGVKKAHKS